MGTIILARYYAEAVVSHLASLCSAVALGAVPVSSVCWRPCSKCTGS